MVRPQIIAAIHHTVIINVLFIFYNSDKSFCFYLDTDDRVLVTVNGLNDDGNLIGAANDEKTLSCNAEGRIQFTLSMYMV